MNTNAAVWESNDDEMDYYEETKKRASEGVLGAIGNAAKGATSGLALGAALGSVIPGVGTVIGGTIGAIGGAIIGGFSSLFGRR